MSAPKNELLKAVELALAGDWDAAHDLVQQYESDATAAWIHAVLHKVEGDLGNSRYWHRHAGQMEYIDVDEYVEATPKNLRLRKKILDENQRKRSEKGRAIKFVE